AVAQQEEGERLLRVVAGGGQALAHGAQPGQQQRVLQRVAVVAQLAQHHRPVLGLLGGRDHGGGGGADIGQPRLLRRRGGVQHGGERGGQGGGGEGRAHLGPEHRGNGGAARPAGERAVNPPRGWKTGT